MRMMNTRNSSLRKIHVGSVPVFLNVYDITPVNGYAAHWLGIGVYHSGLQVYGIEYAFGAHKYRTSGIFEGKPKQCEGFRFRKTILMGWTEKKAGAVKAVMEDLAKDYRGNAYNLVTRNCNHFCNEACVRLTGNCIPNWVNRLARIGLFCNCVVPVTLSAAKIQQRNEEENDGGLKKDVRHKRSILLTSSPLMSSSSPFWSVLKTRKRGRSGFPPPTPLILRCSSATC